MKATITKLENAVLDTKLLDGELLRDMYFGNVFNGLLGTYIELNKHAIQPGANGAGKERQELFSTFLAYIPDIASERYIAEGLLHTAPDLQPLADTDFRARIEELTAISHDGVIGWDAQHLSRNYLSFADIGLRAKQAADIRLGRSSSIVEAVAPFLGTANTGPSGQKLTLGMKTLNGALAPLAIPGAVTYVLKCTRHAHGLGRVLMFDAGGLSIEGRLETKDGLAPHLYLIPNHNIAIVRQDYSFDEAKRCVVPQQQHILPPQQLGIEPFDIRY